MTSLATLTAQLEALKAQRASLHDQIRPLQEQVSAISNEMSVITEAITVETLKSEQTEQERFDFVMAELGYGTDNVRYQAAQKLIESMGLHSSGYCPFSQQRAVDVIILKFSLNLNQRTIASVKKLVTMLKPMDEDGNIKFKVFCQDYTIFAHPEGTFSLRDGRFRRDFDTLEALFTYYVDNHECYDSPTDDDD